MAVAGKVMPRSRGPYSSVEVYEILDIVTLNNKVWICKQPSTINVEPSKETSEVWDLLIDGSIGDATTLDGYDSTHFAIANHEHTAEEIGAVPITGGTMTGGLGIELDWGGYYIKDSSKRDGFFEKNTNSGAVNLGTLNDVNNTQFLTVMPETEQLRDAVMLNRTVDGEAMSYRLYGEHNPPVISSAEDIGAVPITGGIMTGGLAVQQDWGGFYIKDTSGRDGFFEKNTNSGAINLGNIKDENNTQFITVAPETDTLGNAVVLNRTVNGNAVTYKLYGEHNKPTPAAIGAATVSNYTATFSASNWTGSGPYTQTLTVNGILASDDPIAAVSIGSASTAENVEAIYNAWSLVGKIVTAANKITATCYSGKPEVNFTVKLKVVR